ncbi:bifunctional riboflavin kinase/FAD synthetase [Helicobacter saguini]|uniref:riboflavin kinase n=1 Tax=Helicobacter saguini TaxID=1548018 RepID=A0A6L7D440_9HELI|nr:riboflavin kinase [Helicobacter saguini]MWV62796.1 bifunctional riboflavin kinase/FAD synthetase [Helicobacter saguini]MWV66535.1 bifunctional riboflavin kinase/FAD synthetase [Helicobacter saguini]MWV68884.1 bifunctional riboflavin kinase/FAD synthetase [Helicobacter saguini]MWV71562.1 bifunctional riboflavin kinase/FAD synthetase [Helicobacter saguini]
MKSFFFYLDSKLPFTSVAIGKFDGMHKAHLRLLEQLNESEDSKDLKQNENKDSTQIENTKKDSKFIESKSQNFKDSTQNKKIDSKACALSIASIKTPFVTPPNERQKYANVPFFRLKFELIKSWDSLKFLKLLFEIMPNLQEIIVGYDFCFGANRASNVLDLRDMLDSINRNYVKVKVIESITYNGTPIHTSIIKELLKYGDMDSANAMLGRFFSIKGRIIKGQGLGKKSLYPTINIKNSLNIIPKFGVYASFVEFCDDIFDEKSSKNTNFMQKRFYKAVTFIGNRLSTDKHFSIETHIIESAKSSKNHNFIESKDSKTLQDCIESNVTFNEKNSINYNLESALKTTTHIRIFFVQMLRNNKKFSDLNALKTQISKDIESAKLILQNANQNLCK